MSIYIEGKKPLQGTISASGAKNSAQKLIIAATYSNQDVILENVPRLESVYLDLEIVRSLGGKVEWIGNNKLLINGSTINSWEIPDDVGKRYRTAFLLAGPLMFRFGKARIPKFLSQNKTAAPINRILETWRLLGFRVTEAAEYFELTLDTPKAADVSFRTSTHTGTDNAILSALFISGETTINNASEEPEIDDLIEFCNQLGAKVTRFESRKIKIEGVNVFHGTTYRVIPDKYEVAFFATAAILTKGNVIIKNINKMSILPFINFLTKLGVNFEVTNDELKVWNVSGELTALNITTNPSPGFIPDWQLLAVALLTLADGTSTIHDTVYVNRFPYVNDLNRMGAHIELVKPSSLGLIPVISDDSYNFEVDGEPLTIAKIEGPTKFRADRIHVSDYRYADAILLAALSAEGKSEILEYQANYEQIENLFDKLLSLGAKITR